MYSSALNSTSTPFLSRNHGTAPKMTLRPGKKFLHFKESTLVIELWMKNLDSPLKQPQRTTRWTCKVSNSLGDSSIPSSTLKKVLDHTDISFLNGTGGQLTSPTVFQPNNQREVRKETALLSKTTILLSLLDFANLLTISLFSAKPEQEANRRGRDTVKPEL